MEGIQESVGCCYLLSGILNNIYISFMFFGILCFNQKVYITFTIRKTNYKSSSILENSNKAILRWCPIASGDIFKYLNVSFKAFHKAIPFCMPSINSCLICLSTLYLAKIPASTPHSSLITSCHFSCFSFRIE